MILPDKYIPVSETLLGLGAIALESIKDAPLPLRILRDKMVARKEVGTYIRFVHALDLLYALGLIELSNGVVRRTVR
ncbi:MAG: hypothetical protein K6G91_14520 [Kiritimatiellae bacterium]|nr:hypothetical protein [Kiritimatiellia bacterium]